MPTVNVTAGITNPILVMMTQLDEVFLGESGGIVGIPSATTIVVDTGDGVTTTFSGTGFAYDEEANWVGGTVDSVVFDFGGGETATVGSLNLMVSALVGAYISEESGADNAAVENLLLPLGWDVTSNNNVDFIFETLTTSDGIPLNFSGDDIYKALGGHDFVGGGDGDDQIFGGNGNDVLEGNDGKDEIRGGNGHDSINGGDQRDVLRGGKGEDTLSGGDARDVLRGGHGDDEIRGEGGADRLYGGAGDDTFVFFEDDGNDVLKDYDVTTQADEIRLSSLDGSSTGTSMSNSGGDVLVTYQGGTILLEGITYGEELTFGDLNISFFSEGS